MKRILITGISGFIGQYLYKYRPKDIQLTGTYFLNKPKLEGVALEYLDLKKVDNFTKNSMFNYDVVIHCAAEANLGECEKQPENAFLINTHASEKLAQWSQVQNSKFIFLSTDIVFDGEKGNYTEEDNPCPINVYGSTKLEAEQKVLNTHHNAVVIRLALCLGSDLGSKNSFIDWFLSKLEHNEEIPLFNDEFRTPVSSIFAVKAIWEMVNNNFKGIIHLTGKEKINRFDLGLKILQYDDRLNKQFLLKKISSLIKAYPRPKDVSMKSIFQDKYLNTPQEDLITLIKNIL
jgi:dTDP-4-dehydrorhamnose reductase